DLDHNAPPNAALDDVSGRLDHLGEPDFSRDVRKLSPIEVAPQALPRDLPLRDRTHDGIDAEQRNATQNKRSNGTRQIHAAGKPTCRYRSPIASHRQHIRERGRPDGVDSTGPTLFSQRFCGSCELLALDDLARAELFQIIGLLRTPG